MLLVVVGVFGETYYVNQDGTEDFTEIQAAINVAVDGDMIVVAPGIYQENLLIENLESVSISGRNASETIIYGIASTINSIVKISSCNGVNFENFTISGEGIGGCIMELSNYTYNSTIGNLIFRENHTCRCLISLGFGNENYFHNIIADDNSMSAAVFMIASGEYSTNFFKNLTIIEDSNNMLYVFWGYPYNDQTNGGDLVVSNSIISYDYQIANYGFTSIDIIYSNVEGGWEGEGNIDTDPLLDESYQPIWTETQISPCIDSGNPNSPLDADGTPPDIGAVYYPHDYHITTATSGRYRYRSFPVLDGIYNEGFETTYVCEAVEEQTSSFKILDQDGYDNVWDEEYGWTGDLDNLESVKGYKLHTVDDVEIPTSGITLPENTRVYLEAGRQNWIGYFPKESMSMTDAFADVSDHLLSISGEDWAWDNSNTYPSDRCGLIYGKMYVVKVDEDCDFVYGGGEPVIPREREKTTGFDYTETPEYTPINILSIDDPDIEEIGIFVDGICKGATKVEEFPLQIFAFVEDENRGADDISFGFYYGDRRYRQTKEFAVFDEESGAFTEKSIELKPYEFQTIRFGEADEISLTFELLSNYPNPFNPSTTISYSIPTESKVELTIYNIKGQKVKTLTNDKFDKGKHSVIWDGDDDSGKSVSSGIYFYKLKSGKESSVKRMLLLK